MSIVNYKKKEKLELDFFDQKDFALLLKNCTCILTPSYRIEKYD